MQYLPTRALLNIFELVSDEELCTVGLVSRRLHDIALELFLLRHYTGDFGGLNSGLHITIPPAQSRKASFFLIHRRSISMKLSVIEQLICDYRTHHTYPLFSLEITLQPLLGLLKKLVTVKKLTLNLSGHFIQNDVRSSILGLLRKPLVHSSCWELMLKYNGGDFIYKRRKGFLSTLIPSHPSAWMTKRVHVEHISCGESSKFTELPQEIILLICQHLPTEDLYLLTQLPLPNLKRWVSSVYMRRKDKAKSTMDSVQIRLLEMRREIVLSRLDCVGGKLLATSSIFYMRKIACCPSIQTIHHLCCKVQQNRPDVVFEFLHELHRLVLAVSTIRKFTFDFACDTSQWGTFPVISRAFSNLIWRIFDLVVRRSCTLSSYAIKGSTATCNPHDFLPTTRSWRSTSTLTLDGKASNNRGLPSWATLSSETAHITHLDVLGSTSGSLAHLTELHVVGGRLLPALRGVLRETPRLVSLSLREFDIESQKVCYRRTKSMPRLPYLRNLTAPYVYIMFWNNSNALPSLERLVLFLGSWNDLTYASPCRLETLTRFVQRLSLRRVFVRFSVEIPLQAAENMVAEDEPFNFNTKPKMSDLLSWVKEIAFSNYDRRLSASIRSASRMCAVTAQCMAMFPAVRIYAFKGMDNRRISQALRGIGLNSLDVKMPVHAQMLLASMRSSQVPLISTVIVDGVELTDDEVIDLYFK